MTMEELAKNKHTDFHHTSNVNQGTMFPILQSYCACGKRIGCFQRTIESEIGKEMIELAKDGKLNQFEIRSAARRNSFARLGFRRDCCLLALTMIPCLTVNDIEGEDAYIDFTAQTNANTVGENQYLPYNYPNRPGEFFPVKRDDIGFDMDKYCRQLHSMTFSDPKEAEYEKLNPEFVTFPNIKTSTNTYPILDLIEEADQFE